MTPEQVARAFRWACEAELAALKPGNVHVHGGPKHGEGHGMTGSGLYIANAPFGTAEEAERLGALFAELTR